VNIANSPRVGQPRITPCAEVTPASTAPTRTGDPCRQELEINPYNSRLRWSNSGSIGWLNLTAVIVICFTVCFVAEERYGDLRIWATAEPRSVQLERAVDAASGAIQTPASEFRVRKRRVR
jgi:hypothetical protein